MKGPGFSRAVKLRKTMATLVAEVHPGDDMISSEACSAVPSATTFGLRRLAFRVCKKSGIAHDLKGPRFSRAVRLRKSVATLVADVHPRDDMISSEACSAMPSATTYDYTFGLKGPAFRVCQKSGLASVLKGPGFSRAVRLRKSIATLVAEVHPRDHITPRPFAVA